MPICRSTRRESCRGQAFFPTATLLFCDRYCVIRGFDFSKSNSSSLHLTDEGLGRGRGGSWGGSKWLGDAWQEEGGNSERLGGSGETRVLEEGIRGTWWFETDSEKPKWFDEMEVRGCSGRAVWIRSRRTGGAFGRLGPPWNDEVEMLPNEHYKGIPALQEWGQTQETLCVGKCEKCEKCACSPRWRSKGVPGTLP